MKVTVTGTMDADELVEYVYRRTKKQAKIVPQPEPEEKKEAEKPAEEPKPEEKKEEGEGAEKKEEGGEKPPDEEKKEGGAGENENSTGKEAAGDEQNIMNVVTGDEQAMQRMMYYYQPLYVMERIPPPQLFSDENPNACCITWIWNLYNFDHGSMIIRL